MVCSKTKNGKASGPDDQANSENNADGSVRHGLQSSSITPLKLRACPMIGQRAPRLRLFNVSEIPADEPHFKDLRKSS
ncbi:unnamed protein product [Strongylus vulgaris]|uniref:Uncharacterized protein n=1 Tax=Strongylus vulgaris TaxID=40348 RepID=A0A3P7JEB2_STRVU|nr:unnamed protein product [Strongylus vulgaris]